MNHKRICSVAAFFGILALSSVVPAQNLGKIQIAAPPSAPPCITYAAQRMKAALTASEYAAEITTPAEFAPQPNTILIGTKDDGPEFARLIQPLADKKEAFAIVCKPEKSIIIAGSDPAGAMYGTLVIAHNIWNRKGAFPESLEQSESPAFAVRATCLPLQKPCIPDAQNPCDSSITKKNIPWLYEKDKWTSYLDLFAIYRINTLILDNAHPFSSLMNLPDFPQAKEVSEDELKENIKLFQWLAEQTDSRGITLVLRFCTPVPDPLAPKNNAPAKWDNSAPVNKEYLKACLKEFIAQHPHVGLMPDLGTLPNEESASEWICKIILPAVKEGLKAANADSEPPLILLSSLTGIQNIVPETLALYKNMYTLTDRSGQVLASEQIQGKARTQQQELAKLGSVSITAVNMPVNLAPFRYGSTRFIWNSVHDAREIGFAGIMVSPLHYWDWPYSNGRGSNRRTQIFRDWIWFDAWFRYAWKPDRDPAEEKQYWMNRLNEKFQNQNAAEQILEAYENAGQCAPLILRSFALTDSARQTLSMGMTMPQFLYPERFGLTPDFWLAYAPVPERIQDYVHRETQKLPHEGQTPPQTIQEIRTYAKNALDAIEKAKPYSGNNQAEYRQIRMDIQAIFLVSEFYAHRAEAVLQILQYASTGDLETLKKAERLVERSIIFYDKICLSLTDYYSRPMTLMNQQEIPFPIKDAAYQNWDECLNFYEKEFNTFEWHVNSLLQGSPAPHEKKNLPALAPLEFTLQTPNMETYEIQTGAKLFTDRPETIDAVASELVGLKGIRISDQQARRQETKIEIELHQPAKILVGYFDDTPSEYARFYHLQINENYPVQDPMETMAIRYALQSSGLPPVHVWAYPLEVGKQTFQLKQGTFLILGVVPAVEKITPRTVFTPAKDLTWFFE